MVPGHAQVAARLRTGSPLLVMNVSPDGLLVETPVRLLPGHRVDLVLQRGDVQERAHSLVVHSRVGYIRGSGDLRYRVGLSLAGRTCYPHGPSPGEAGKGLPGASGLIGTSQRGHPHVQAGSPPGMPRGKGFAT